MWVYKLYDYTPMPAIKLQNVPQDTLTQTMISTAKSLVVILHTELGVRIGVTVPRRAAITSTGV